MHLLNKNPLPQERVESNNKNDNRVYDLGSYTTAVLFLTIIFFVSQAFSFVALRDGVLNIFSDIRGGGQVAVDTIDKKIDQGFSFLDPQSIFVDGFNVFSSIGGMSSDFLAGVTQGTELFSDNLSFIAISVRQTILDSIYASKTAVYGSLDLANNKITEVGKQVSSYLEGMPNDDINFLSAVVKTNNDNSTTTLATITEPDESYDVPNWSSLFFRLGFFPTFFKSYEDQVSPMRTFINTGIIAIVNTKNSIGDTVYLSWSNFLDQIFKEDSNLTDKILRDQLKQEILAELQGNDTVTVQAGSEDSIYTNNGIILLKQSGSNTIDLNNVKQIQDSFSDRVILNFDNDGETGIIQPIFRDRLGEKYIFVITPVKK